MDKLSERLEAVAEKACKVAFASKDADHVQFANDLQDAAAIVRAWEGAAVADVSIAGCNYAELDLPDGHGLTIGETVRLVPEAGR